MVVPTTSLAQARDIDILIFKLQELRSDESELEQDVKTASEKVKKLVIVQRGKLPLKKKNSMVIKQR